MMISQYIKSQFTSLCLVKRCVHYIGSSKWVNQGEISNAATVCKMYAYYRQTTKIH